MFGNCVVFLYNIAVFMAGKADYMVNHPIAYHDEDDPWGTSIVAS